MIMFLRHRSGPFYLGLEIANWRFLRQSGDVAAVPGFDTDDLVVDSQAELLWRLRALYGVKNAKGTKMLTIGGLAAYSSLAQENGPRVAKEMWGYEFVNVTDEEFAARLKAARESNEVVRKVEAQTAVLLKLPNVRLETDRKSVFNSYLAMHVCRQLLQETGASNFGFAHCMGRGQIAMLGTPPCFVLSLANDEGYTAYCHTDLSHTMPGVLLRWIASRPTFVCNSHHPHEGVFLVAHCQAPRRMNGQDYEPATIMTHYESDYGAACKTQYTQDQVVTVVVPNLACNKWQGFRGKVVGSPSYPACRSQMEILVDGDWRRLQREMEGFHTQVVYGDYLREAGYALKKVGPQIAWQCFS
jgi:L-fucose isomerase-like protein